jgi:hypothetical protein
MSNLIICPPSSRDDDIPKKPLTPEEIRENEKVETTMWAGLFSAVFAAIGLFSLLIGILSEGVWGHIIGFVFILFSFLVIISTRDNDDDVHGEVIRKMDGGIVSFLFLASAFFLVLAFSGFIEGAILYLLGFILAFKVSKIYGIMSAVILLGLHLLLLLD